MRQKSDLRRLLLAGAAGTLLAFSAAPTAFAAGDGGSSSDTTPKCNDGWVLDPKTKLCVPQQSGIVDDNALADYAYALARDGRYNAALGVLDLVADKTGNAKVLNYRGFVTRKLGDVDGGIGFYLAGLQLDPNYVQLREYLGEAYVTKGRLDLAREQLAAIEGLCGKDCEHYVQLAAHIDGNPLPPTW